MTPPHGIATFNKRAVFAVLILATPACLIAQTGAPSHTSHMAASQITAEDQKVLGQALDAYDQGNDELAATALGPLATRYPGNFEIAETLGLIYAERQDYQRALPLLETASHTHLHAAVASANLGTAYLKAGHTEEAIATLSRAAQLDPKNAQTQSNYGQALMQGNQPGEAAKAFSAASALDPANADYRHDWAAALLDANDPKQARKVAEAIPGRESSAETQSLLADIAEREGDYKAAGAYYKAAVDLDPSEANINALAFEFLRHWTFDPAIKMYQVGLAKYPDSVRLRLGLGIAEYASNNYAASAPIFSALLAKDPDNALYADLLGHSCSLIADEQGTGCDSLEAFAERHPKNAEAATYAAASILHRPIDEDQLGKAKRLLDSALAADPGLAEAHYTLGLLYQQQKQWAASVPPLEEAVAIRPKFSEAHYHLARSYFQLGRKDEGQREISLQQKYSQQAKDDLNERFKTLTTFLVTVR